MVGVDPATTSGPASDETGIVVAGKDAQGHVYVLADRSCRVTPKRWADRIVQTYLDFMADYVAVEKTAGDLLKENLEAADATMPVRYVTAKQGKRLRASPVANLYEKGVVHHMHRFMKDSDALGKLEETHAVAPRHHRGTPSAPGPTPSGGRDRGNSLANTASTSRSVWLYLGRLTCRRSTRQLVPQDRDLHVLRIRRRPDLEQPEHPPQQHEPDSADHSRIMPPQHSRWSAA